MSDGVLVEVSRVLYSTRVESLGRPAPYRIKSGSRFHIAKNTILHCRITKTGLNLWSFICFPFVATGQYLTLSDAGYYPAALTKIK